MKTINTNDEQISEFLLNGFAKSDPKLLSKLRRRQINWRIFKFGLSSKRGTGKYSSFDLVGEYHNYYFIVGMEECLIKHLVNLFNLTNPLAPPHMKGAFNNRLRINYLIDNKKCVFK